MLNERHLDIADLKKTCHPIHEVMDDRFLDFMVQPLSIL